MVRTCNERTKRRKKILKLNQIDKLEWFLVELDFKYTFNTPAVCRHKRSYVSFTRMDQWNILTLYIIYNNADKNTN